MNKVSITFLLAGCCAILAGCPTSPGKSGQPANQQQVSAAPPLTISLVCMVGTIVV